jgi:hypothetical protein
MVMAQASLDARSTAAMMMVSQSNIVKNDTNDHPALQKETAARGRPLGKGAGDQAFSTSSTRSGVNGR